MTGFFLLGISITAAVYFTLKPMYAAQATVLVSNQQIPEEFVRSTVSGLDSLSNINAMAGEILSYKSLGGLIEEYDLYANERVRTELTDVIALMRQSISIQPGENIGGGRRGHENASIFMIEFISSNPESAAVIANELAAGFIDSSIRRRNQQARTTTEFMERELDRAAGTLADTKASITKFHVAHRGSMPMDQETILRKLERLETHRQSLNEQILSEEERVASLRAISDTPTQNTPESRLAEFKLAMISQLALHTKEHPSVIALEQQIKELENQIDDVNEVYAKSERAHEDRLAVVLRGLEGMRLEFSEIDAEMASLDKRAAEIPQNAEAFDALTQNLRVLEENYLEFLRKVQDAKLAEELERAQQGPRVTVLDRASPPSVPIRSSMRYLQLGLAVSLILAIGVAMVAELIDPAVLDPAHFGHIGDAPMLGSIYTQ